MTRLVEFTVEGCSHHGAFIRCGGTGPLQEAGDLTMLYHDNPRRSVHPDFRPVRLTRKVLRDRARMFVRAVTSPDRQWDMGTMRNYCTPAGYHLPDEAIFSDRLTIEAVANFLATNLRRH